MTAVSTINYSNANIHSTEDSKKISDWTSAKIKQFALYFFAILLVSVVIAACLLIPSPYNFLPVAAGLPILGVTHSAHKIKDYENPEKLAQYKAEAAGMTFQKIYDEFGLKNALQYKLVPLDTLKDKFSKQVQEMDFCSVLESYSLSDLSSVATPAHIEMLKNLQLREAQFRAEYNATAQNTQSRLDFHRGVNRLEQQYSRFKTTHLL